MKLWQIVGGTALSLTLAGCASQHSTPAQEAPANTSASPSGPAITGPNVSGTVNISQRIALPPDAVLTVTMSDASMSDAPSRVIAQKVARTGGKQSPFTFILPYNPQDIVPIATKPAGLGPMSNPNNQGLEAAPTAPAPAPVDPAPAQPMY